MQERKEQVTFIIVMSILLGLALRIGYALKYPVQQRDTYEYLSFIQQWETTGAVPKDYQGTFSLWLLNIPHHYFDIDLIKSGIIINNLFGVAVIGLIILITAFLFKNIYVVLLSGIIAATHHQLILYSESFLRENSYLLFMLLYALSTSRYYFRNNIILLAVSGLMTALSFLCRMEALELTIITIIVICYCTIGKKKSYLKGVIHSIVYIMFYIASIGFVCYSLDIKHISPRALFEEVHNPYME